MSEYYKICNIDKKEFLEPGLFGQLNKPGDWKEDPHLLLGLAVLLRLTGRDLESDKLVPLKFRVIYGRWAGDKIAIVSDYLTGSFGGINWSQDYWNLLSAPENGWVNISEHVRMLLEQDFEIKFDNAKIDQYTEEMYDEPRSILHHDGTISALPYPDEIDSEQGVEIVLKALKSSNVAERFWAIRTAGILNYKNFLPLLETLLKTEQGIYLRRNREILLKNWIVEVVARIKTTGSFFQNK